MVGVRETVPGDWQALRDIRLEALRDAPSAFASSYACEAARGEEHWRGRSSGGGMFLAYLPEASQASASQASAIQASVIQARSRPGWPAATRPIPSPWSWFPCTSDRGAAAAAWARRSWPP